MGAEVIKAYSVCLAQKEKMQILQKEVKLKISLTDVKRCWGKNSMWYQEKKKNPTCFSQVQIRTTHRLFDCSKGIDQCSVRLWAALLSSVGSGGIWLIQEYLQLTLGYVRSCKRPLIPREPGITISTDDTLVIDYGCVKGAADVFPGKSSESNVPFTDSTIQGILNVLASLWPAIFLRSFPTFLNTELSSPSPAGLFPVTGIKWIILSWPLPGTVCNNPGSGQETSTPNGLTSSESVSKTVETRNRSFKRRVSGLCQRIHNLGKWIQSTEEHYLNISLPQHNHFIPNEEGSNSFLLSLENTASCCVQCPLCLCFNWLTKPYSL